MNLLIFLNLYEFFQISFRVDAPLVATVLIVAIFAIKLFKSLALHIFVLILG